MLGQINYFVTPQVHLMVNGDEILSIYDRDISGYNKRFAMISQSMIQKLEKGDQGRDSPTFLTLTSS
jgi:hypothetical protein